MSRNSDIDQVASEVNVKPVNYDPNKIYSKRERNSSDEEDDAEPETFLHTQQLVRKDAPSTSSQAVATEEDVTEHHYVDEECVIKNEIDAFFKIITDDTLEHIVRNTNLDATLKEKMTKEELMAFIGLLYLISIKNAPHQVSSNLWTDDDDGINIFHAVMSRKRFQVLLNKIEFDNENSRALPMGFDYFADVRNIWDKFLRNCRKSYKPSGQFAFYDRLRICKGAWYSTYLRRFIFKVWTAGLVDIRTNFICNVELQYTDENQSADQSAATIHRLVDSIKGTEKHVTICDNRTNLPDNEQGLLSKTVTFLYVQDKRKIISHCSTHNKPQAVNSWAFYVSGNITVALPKCHHSCTKSFQLLSTVPNSTEINQQTNIPVIVEHYSAARKIVDAIRYLKYSISGIHAKSGIDTIRMHTRVFFMLLDFAGINAHVLYNVSRNDSLKKSRMLFLKNLALDLVNPLLQMKAKNQLKGVPIPIRRTIIEQLRSRTADSSTNQSLNNSMMVALTKCFLCSKARKVDKISVKCTSKKCCTCARFTCDDHLISRYCCKNCK